MRRFLFLLCAGLCLSTALAADDVKIPEWAKGRTIRNGLDDPSLADELAFSDPAVWSFGKGKEGGYLQLDYDRKKYKSSYSPKHRSPIHIALLKNHPLTDFVMDLEATSTTEPYGHQDLCLFFGFESPARYYYVHIGRAADMNAHNVFIVNDAPRKNIAKETTKGVDWKKDAWHKVRLVRQATAGQIEVYFDDMTKPIMKADDKTFQKGYVGFGSFDDTGRFRNLKVFTKEAQMKPASFFKPLGK